MAFVNVVIAAGKSNCTVLSKVLVTTLLGRGKRSKNRKCNVSGGQLKNRNDGVDSVGGSPTESTAGNTTDKKAWEPILSDD